VIDTVAGPNWVAPAGGVAGRNLSLLYPRGGAVDGKGNFYFADRDLALVFRMAPDGTLTVVAGNGQSDLATDSGPATQLPIFQPAAVAVDAAGNVYIADSAIRVVTTNGIMRTLTFTVPPGEASLVSASGLAVDAAGNLYIADDVGGRVHKVTAAGVMTTIAGNGGSGFNGDGVQATSATLNLPRGVAVDAAGNLYIADSYNSRVRKVSASGVITTVAGSGKQAAPTDGVTATSSSLLTPVSVALDAAGNLFFADSSSGEICKVSSAGTLNIVAGRPRNVGESTFLGDGGVATKAVMNVPEGLGVDASGNLYVADSRNGRVRKVTAGIIDTAAGNALSSALGDGGAAVSSPLASPAGVVADSSGNLFIADSSSARVRKVTPAGIISTVAGTGYPGYGGDGGVATAAQLSAPAGLALDSTGDLYIADSGNQRIRKVTPAGIISTVAGGTGTRPDGSLTLPVSIAVDTAGNLYVADRSKQSVFKVAPGGTLSKFAGTGTSGFSGDGGPAVSAALSWPSGVALDAAGNLYIADSSNDRVRRVALDGTINTVAGGGVAGGGSGDGTQATSVWLYSPQAVAVDAAGNLYIASGSYLRKVTPGGTISTIAGTDSKEALGDGGPPDHASIGQPGALAFDGSGNLYLADQNTHRVRVIRFGATATRPSVIGVGNAAGVADGISTSTWISLMGTNLSSITRSWDGTDFSGDKLPDHLNDVSVEINGTRIPLSYISPTQINALVGSDTFTGLVSLVVKTNQGQSVPFTAKKGAYSPAFFVYSGTGSFTYVIAQSSATGDYIAPAGSIAGLTTRPARPGEGITIYGTGFGPTNPATIVEHLVAQPAATATAVTVHIDNYNAPVSYAGLISPGLYQINLTVPDIPDSFYSITANVGNGQTSTTYAPTIQVRRADTP